MRDLIALLADTGATASVNPDHVERVLNGLTRIEGATDNLRAALFEIIIGSLVKDVEGGYLRVGDKWRDYETNRDAETDVMLDRPDDKGVLIIECKAKIPNARVSLADAKHWRDNRVPLLHKIFKTDQHLSGKFVTFELWTNVTIGSDAIDWLKAYPPPTEYTVGKTAPSSELTQIKPRRNRLGAFCRSITFIIPLLKSQLKSRVMRDQRQPKHLQSRPYDGDRSELATTRICGTSRGLHDFSGGQTSLQNRRNLRSSPLDDRL